MRPRRDVMRWKGCCIVLLLVMAAGTARNALAQEAPRISPYARGNVPLPPRPSRPLRCEYHANYLHVTGGPSGPGLERVVTVDGARLPLKPARFEYPPRAYIGHLERGPHRARVEVRRGEDVLAWTEGTFRPRVHYYVETLAGEGWTCTTLDGEAVAARRNLRALVRSESLQLRVQVREGESLESDALGAGTSICVSAPFFAWAGDRWQDLSRRPGRDPTEVTLVVSPRPGFLVAPACAFALFFALLLFARWPRAGGGATHLAWSRNCTKGYRGQGRTWSSAKLPTEACPLHALSTELEGVLHTVVADREHALFHFEAAVAAGTAEQAHLALGHTALPAGAHAIDGDLHLLVLDARAAARLREGEVPEPWPRDALERARDIGMMEFTTVAPPSRPRAVLSSLVGALLATGVAFVPAYGWAILGEHRPPIWTGLYSVHLGGFVVGGVGVIASILLARRRPKRVF